MKNTKKERLATLEALAVEREKRYGAIRKDDMAALSLAREDINRRLEQMNQLRDQINSERAKFLARDLFDKMHDTLSARVRDLELNRGQDKLTPLLAGLRYVGYVLAVMLGAVATWYLKANF